MRILALIGALSLAGCGPSTSDPDVSGALDSFIEQAAAAQCAWEFRCCTDAEIKSADGRKYSDANGCVPYHALTLEKQLYVARLAAHQRRVRLDGGKAQACLLMLMERACNPRPGTAASTPSGSPDACVDVFDGATPVGEPCWFAAECVAGAHCVIGAQRSSGGVCVPYQQTGEVCNDGADCAPPLACDAATSTCQSPPDGGAPPAAPSSSPSDRCVGRS
jgi:hypothetical protein